MDLTTLTEIGNISSVDLTRTIESILLALILGAFIAWTHLRLNQGFSYERGFSITLIMVTMIASCVMVAIGSNIALSLGLIGALSIIRFRAVLKNTLDMAYLFWGISIGIAIGAGTFMLAIVFSLILGFSLWAINKYNLISKRNEDYIVIISAFKNADTSQIEAVIKSYGDKADLRSASTDQNTGNSEYIYAFTQSKTVKPFSQLLDKLRELESVQEVSMFSPNTNINV